MLPNHGTLSLPFLHVTVQRPYIQYYRLVAG